MCIYPYKYFLSNISYLILHVILNLYVKGNYSRLNVKFRTFIMSEMLQYPWVILATDKITVT